MTTATRPVLDSETMDMIPESLRNAFMQGSVQHTDGPDPFGTFKYLQEVEEFKTKVRESSALYKLFKENIFRFTSPNGQLNLDIQLYDIDGVLRKLGEVQDMLSTAATAVREIGDGSVQVSSKENGEPILLRYDSTRVYLYNMRLYGRCSEMCKQILPLRDSQRPLQYFHLSAKERDLLSESGRLVRQAEQASDEEGRTIMMNVFVYARSTIRMQPLARAVHTAYQ